MKFNNYVGCRKRRAVAPIIATLLMIAIAVVGGVMIYVFTQGFFKGTSTTTPSTDILTITGYDMKSKPLRYFDGVAQAASLGVAGTCCATSDFISINVKNVGTQQLSISSVKVDGIGALYKSSALASGDTGKWAFYTSNATSITTPPTLASGAEGTIIYGVPVAITAGKTVSISVVTSNGDFSSQAIAGQRQ